MFFSGVCSAGVCGGEPRTGYIGANNPTGGLVPQITKPTQVIVKGPDYTGPRTTVVDTANPASWPAWITAVNGTPVDSGAPGGTYQAQRLPDLNVSGRAWWWVPLLILGVLLVMANARRS